MPRLIRLSLAALCAIASGVCAVYGVDPWIVATLGAAAAGLGGPAMSALARATQAAFSGPPAAPLPVGDEKPTEGDVGAVGEGK